MDNDSGLKKKLVSIYRNTKLKMDYKRMGIVTEEDGNKLIYNMIQQEAPFMVGRFGAVEMHCVSKWMQKKVCTDEEKYQALYAAGIFPNDDTTIARFCEVYTASMKQCDIVGVWEVTSEKKAIQTYCNNPILVPSRAIEPYYYSEPWSSNLREKKVLIVHPFIDSIRSQLNHKDKLWDNPDVLPDFCNVSFVKAVQSNAGNKTDFDSWFDALEHMKNEITKTDFEIAIIGAGAYGLTLAAYCKSIGKKAVQMSGATQILFGIKGKRWDNHPVISKFYNDAWVRPSANETPPDAKKVEGGSYW